MNEQIRLVRRADLAEGHHTDGMRRDEAIDAAGLWSGLAHTEPGAASGWHHHGDYRTSIFVVSGRLRMESGAGGRQVDEAAAGDFLEVPPWVVHREINPGDDASLLVVTRAGTGPAVVNVDGPTG